MMVLLLLPSLASASPEVLEPIVLRKTWLTNSQQLEPIVLKKPASMIEAERLKSSPKPDVSAIEEAPASLAPVASAPSEEDMAVDETSDAMTDTVADVMDEQPQVGDTPKTRSFNERIQSLADAPRERPSTLNVAKDTVLPVALAAMSVSAESIQADDTTINKIIDVADQYADVPQLLLEVRGIAPMSATSAEREAAYQNAQLIMSGLVSAGVPYHRIAAFVMLMDAAPGQVHIIRTR